MLVIADEYKTKSDELAVTYGYSLQLYCATIINSYNLQLYDAAIGRGEWLGEEIRGYGSSTVWFMLAETSSYS